jgi:hypothetical protein
VLDHPSITLPDIDAHYRAMLKARLTADFPVGRQRRIDIPTSGAASEATAQNANGFQSRHSTQKEKKQCEES